MRLSKIAYEKRSFDPSSKKDRDAAFRFLKNNSWIGIEESSLCPFHCEWPYVNVPSMLKDKLLEYFAARS